MTLVSAPDILSDLITGEHGKAALKTVVGGIETGLNNALKGPTEEELEDERARQAKSRLDEIQREREEAERKLQAERDTRK